MNLPRPSRLPDLRTELQSALGDAYAVERELPGGGMSRLFLATERALKRAVVIKLLPRELMSEQSSARFQREIELAAQLRHPHILPVHAAGVRDGLLYYVMPFVSGESLRQRLNRDRRLPVEEGLRILEEVADGLAHAHRSGIVHRDVKPENILIEHGHAVITDFGIARILSANRRQSGRITGTGQAIGTLGYMAPEQVAGDEHIDARADVYALGVVGYEMLAGEAPFHGATPREVLASQLNNEPFPVSTRRREVPHTVSEAIRRALQASPDKRYASAQEFSDALRASDVPSDSSPTLLRSMLGGIASWLRAPRAPRAVAKVIPAESCRVALMPFTVRGGGRLDYLGEGMVDLLAGRMDGAGGLCVVDPRATLALVAQRSPKTIDPTAAREVADKLGAGLHVLGVLIEAGGGVQASASMYDASGTTVASATANIASESELSHLVDQLVIGLLAGRERSTGSVTLGGSMTTRLDALTAFLEGERHLRSGQYALAVDALHRSTRADPEFALAWYRLSLAAEWGAQRDIQDHAAEKALEHGAKLSDRERQLLEAFVAWRRGDVRAESLYRNILAAFPHELEAWMQLGEVIFHYGPVSGRSTSESREAWERVLALDPSHLGALFHLTRIAATEGNTGELRALTQRALAVNRDGERACELRALEAFATRDESAQRDVLEELRRAGDFPLNVTLRTLATHGDDLTGTLEVAAIATEASRDRDFRALAHAQRAYLEMARDRVDAAHAELDAAERLDSAFAIVSRGYFVALPFVEVSAARLEAVRAELLAWDACGTPPGGRGSLFVHVHDGAHPHLRAYLLAMVSLRMGDQASALRYAAELELPDEATASLPSKLARSLARAIHAHVAIARGQGATALAALERANREWGYPMMLASPFYSGALERFTLAGLLNEHGRPRDALKLYNSFAEVSLYDLVFLAPSHRARARIHEQLGEVDAAKLYLDRAARLGRTEVRSARPAAGQYPGTLGTLGTTSPRL